MDSTAGGFLGVVGRVRVWLIGLVAWALLLDVAGISLSGDASKSGLVWCRQAGAFALYFVVVTVLRVLWPIRVTRSNPFKLIGGGKSLRVHTFTGETHSVSSTTTSTTTGQGTIYTGADGRPQGQVNIQTRHERLDTFSLTNEHSQQHTVQVTGAYVPVGAGQRMTAAWAIPRGNKTGKYVVFVNHSTGTTTFANDGIARIILGNRIGWTVCASLVSGLFLTIGGYPVAFAWMFGALAVFAFVSRIQMVIFRRVTSRPLVRALKVQGAPVVAPTPATVTTMRAPTAAAAPATPSSTTAAPPPPPPPPVQTTPTTPPGWVADPHGRHGHRFWDGSRWTEHVSDAGVASIDPAY